MTNERMNEFIVMLLLERLTDKSDKFSNYIVERYDTESFNNRYIELLDEFLNQYALNNTEKSEEHKQQLNFYLCCEIFKT